MYLILVKLKQADFSRLFAHLVFHENLLLELCRLFTESVFSLRTPFLAALRINLLSAASLRSPHHILL